MFQGVSTSGTSIVQIQLGSTTFTTTGYLSGGSTTTTLSTTAANSTTGLLTAATGGAPDTRHGAYVLTNISSNTWVMQGNCALSGAIYTSTGAGSIALSGVLDRVRITTVNGTDTFDAGSINILYE
jgi:hypothetical protein